MTKTDLCARCAKPLSVCFCAELKPRETRLRVLILQHPQEPKETLGTARLALLLLARAELKVGLSWRNLSAALGSEAKPPNWAVLYLGAHGAATAPGRALMSFVDKKGVPLKDSSRIAENLEGLVVLDGTWSQAKALWWRNPWLLKLKRAVLSPPRPSLYGRLRREPRRECLSSIESIAYSLEALGEDPQVSESLISAFQKLLERVS